MRLISLPSRQTCPFPERNHQPARCLVFLLLAGLFLGTAFAADEAKNAAVMEQFLEALKENEAVPPERKTLAVEALGAAHEEDVSLAAAMASALQALYPKLQEAIGKTKQDDGREGLQQLYKLTRAEDPFLSAEAAYAMARTMNAQQRYEESLPFLERLQGDLADFTMRHGDVLYYQGIAMANSLKKEKAIALLAQYLEDYPNASDRLRLSAQATLDGIVGVLDGSVEDIADHMDFSHRRLTFEDSGEQTQEVQEEIVSMLDRIIQQAEEQQQQQQQQQAGGGQGGQGEQQQQQAAGEGQNAGGNANAQNDPKQLRDLRGAAKSAWDDLRDRARETDALSGLKSKYPPRYRELVEQYFKDLQEGEQGETEAPAESIEP